MIPVVDISEHQGNIDFTVMRSRGVQGLIMRITHGRTIDKRAPGYFAQATAAGFAPDEIGFYTFINPKRGSGRACAIDTITIVRAVAGRTNTFLMLDCEDYAAEPPDRGQRPTVGPLYARWVREFIAACAEFAPQLRLLGYSNQSFWGAFVHDVQLAADLEWIAPRYPVYPPAPLLRQAEQGNPGPLNAWVATSPKPPAPAGWEAWANLHGRSGPIPPAGGTAAGWQFSAGFNRQGPAYGCTSSDLDLNIVHLEAWARWTTDPATIPTPSPPVPVEDDMPAKLIRVDGDAAVFAESGLQAVWGRSAAHIAEKQSTGAWSMDPPKVVTRGYLRSLILVGDEPDYSTGDGGLPGRTTRADFAPTPSVPPPVLTGTLTVAGDVHVVG